jgi:cysteine-S-conjugate beta-lyase
METSWKTKLIHTRAAVPDGFRSLAVPTYRGSTTVFPTAATVEDNWNHDKHPYTYGLYGTPTTLALAARIAELERGYRTLITPGGQAALVLIYLAFLATGDHVLVPRSVYGPSRDFADNVLRRYGVDVDYYPALIGAGISELIKDNTRLVWCESPGSITMEVQDVPAIVESAHRRGALVAIDNTWAAGVLFDAFAHGVDVTMQALTKYVGGHSDLLLGSVTVRQNRLYERLASIHYQLGQAVSPDDCGLALRGLQTLGVRLDAVAESALKIARWLATRREIESVLHPALASCPGHDLWSRDFSGSSGVFSVVFKPTVTREQVFGFIDRLELFKIGYSWGGVTSLVIPGGDETGRPDYPYGDRLVRLNIGLEDVRDLIADLEGALAALAR